MLTWREKQSLTKFQKEHHPLSHSLSLSLSLYTGRSADASVKLIFHRKGSLSLSLSQLFTFANESDQDQTQNNSGKKTFGHAIGSMQS